MNEDWDFYMCRVDSKPASIYLNLNAANDAVIQQHPFRAYVRVYMRHPRPEGLSSQEEFDALISVEDALVARLGEESQALYVGRNTSDGCRDFYFYAQLDTGLEQAAQAAMGAFPAYEYEFGVHADPEWQTYFNFLYPSAEDQQRIQNRRVCAALENAGDSFSVERPIEHWTYFPTKQAQTSFANQAQALGFELIETNDPEASQDRYCVRVAGMGIPSLENIDDLTIPLFRLVEACGGNYDGWETRVEVSSEH